MRVSVELSGTRATMLLVCLLHGDVSPHPKSKVVIQIPDQVIIMPLSAHGEGIYYSDSITDFAFA